MNRSLPAPEGFKFDPEIILCHVRGVKKITRATEEGLTNMVAESLNRYREKWHETFYREHVRLVAIIENLNRALAAIIAEEWIFHEDNEYAPFDDEKSAFNWLSGNGENPDAGEPDGYFERENDWTIRSLWDVRAKIGQQLGDLLAADKYRWKWHWTRAPETTANMPDDLQELVHDLCQIWHDQVDPNLGLPRKDPNPDNPLLRFIDAGLMIVLRDKRPAKKSILDFVSKRVRPAIRESDQHKGHYVYIPEAGLIHVDLSCDP